MKKIPLCMLIVCLTHWAYAQSTNYYNRMNHVFGAIDKSKVTTGFLKEFGVRLNEVEAYNGVISTTNWVDETQWHSLYNSLYSMRVGTAASSMSNPTTVFSNLASQQSTNPGVVLLAAQYYTYQQYKSTAYTNGDVTVSSDRIYDVAGRNPYDIKTVFAAAPMKYHLKGNTFSFRLQSNMLYTNTSFILSSIAIDFGNGQGYQTVSLNTTKSITYSSGGEKEMTVRFIYTNGTTLYTHSKLYIDYVPSIAPARFDGRNTRVPFDLAGAQYQGASASGEVTIETAGTDGVLDKPLIIIEGFDPQNTFDYGDLINDSGPGGLNITISQTGQPILTLNQAIENEGYDLVFVNYRNSLDFIQRNAFMLEAVIDWVNANKTGNEPNVVLGMSMGGLVARYALRHMETTGGVHETGLFISHDSPHQGANVPLAFQAFVRHLAGESVGWPVLLSTINIDIVSLRTLAPELGEGFNTLQSPAAQQMLIYQLTGTGGTVSLGTSAIQNTFLTEYRNLGYPSQNGIRNITISNGSECGTPLAFQPYANLATLDRTVDLPSLITNLVFTVLNATSINPLRTLTSSFSTNTDIRAVFSMKALPQNQALNIYTGKVFVKKKVLGFINVEEQLINEKAINSTTPMLPVDNAGGGIYDINTFIADLPAALGEVIQEQRFCFIPTYSSLDIGSGLQPILASDISRPYSNFQPPAGPKNIPFHNFFTNPGINEDHTQFISNNGNWLMAELRGLPQVVACNYMCSNISISPVISGSSYLCTTRPYSISNIAGGQNVAWSTSNSAVATINASGLATKGSSRGPVNIQAVVNGFCGVSGTIIKPIFAGLPYITVYNIPGIGVLNYSGGINDACNMREYTTDVAGPGIQSYTWSRPVANPTTASWSQTGNNVKFNFFQAGQTATFRLNVANTCGSTTYDFKFRSITCSSEPCSSFAVSPNPARAQVRISIPPPCSSAISSGQTLLKAPEVAIESVSLYSQDGILLKTKTIRSRSERKETMLDVSDLKNGVYFLKVTNGSSTETHRIMIKD